MLKGLDAIKRIKDNTFPYICALYEFEYLLDEKVLPKEEVDLLSEVFK